MFKKMLFSLFLAILAGGQAVADNASQKALQTDAAVLAARAVMDDFMTHFNARDEARWADTLLFPHIRVASGGVIVSPSKAEFVAATDLDQFALANNWSHSAWDSIEVIQAGPDKVHFKVQFSRFNPAGEKYVTYNSLYVVQRDGDRWGIRARSSFAP
jgi:hypothetical protein